MTLDLQVKRFNKSPFYKIEGLNSSVCEMTKDFFELYIAKGYSNRTIRAYAFDLLIFLRFYLGKLNEMPPLENIDVRILIKFIQYEKSRNASPASINRRLNTLDLFYRFSFEKQIPGTNSPDYTEGRHLRTRRYITMDSHLGIFPIYSKGRNPFRVRMPHKLIKALEPNEVEQFFKTLHSYRNKSIVLLMLVCGLRSEEVLNLKLSDISRLNSSLKILGKGSKERMVPLPETVSSMLEKYIELERPSGQKSKKIAQVFLSQKGTRKGLPMHLEGLRSVFRYNRAASGVMHANAHRFRHTFGKNMAMAGVTLPVLQKILGHNDYKTTLKYINLTLNDVHDDFARAQDEINKLYAKSIQ